MNLMLEWVTVQLRNIKKTSSKPIRTVRSSMRRRRERSRGRRVGWEECVHQNIEMETVKPRGREEFARNPKRYKVVEV